MTFANFLSEKIERYVELRRSLGYAFDKQAGTLRAFVHHVERFRLDGPATRTMAQDFVLSFPRRRQQSRRSSRGTPPVLRAPRHLRCPNRGLGAQCVP